MIKKILIAVVAIIVAVIGVAVWAFSGRDPLQQYLSQRAEKTSLTLESVFNTNANTYLLVCPGADKQKLNRYVSGDIEPPKEGSNTLVTVTQGKGTAYEYKRDAIDFCVNASDPIRVAHGSMVLNFTQPDQSSRWVLDNG